MKEIVDLMVERKLESDKDFIKSSKERSIKVLEKYLSVYGPHKISIFKPRSILNRACKLLDSYYARHYHIVSAVLHEKTAKYLDELDARIIATD